LKSLFDSTLLPLELATKNGIGLGLGRITRGKMSWTFLLGLKKLDNIVSFCDIVSAIFPPTQRKYMKKKEAKGG
jgi:hypothetical protein